jgi:hypothetical protein
MLPFGWFVMRPRFRVVFLHEEDMDVTDKQIDDAIMRFAGIYTALLFVVAVILVVAIWQ